MDPILLTLLGVLGGAVSVAVAWAIFHRRAVNRPVTDIDDLAVEVERIGRVVRRLNMQRVRGAPPDPEVLPPPLALPEGAGVPVAESKHELRRRVLSMR